MRTSGIFSFLNETALMEDIRPMRLWSLHPEYLDRIGLIALWREALLAQNVLLGKTRGYTRHPQLDRFRSCTDPAGAVGAYLTYIAEHAATRGYRFNTGKVISVAQKVQIAIPAGQIYHEFSHLMKKCTVRSPQHYERYRDEKKIRLHPVFYRVRGGIAPWERTG